VTTLSNPPVQQLRPIVAASLHYGHAQAPPVRVVPDTLYLDMWRMVWPDGRLSDLANLSRIKDAAAVICERGPPPRNRRRLQWKIERSESPSGARGRASAPHPSLSPVSASPTRCSEKASAQVAA
jgi:hypothetical protein